MAFPVPNKRAFDVNAVFDDTDRDKADESRAED